MKRLISIILLLCLILGQGENALPFIQNYSKKDYHFSPLNDGIAQDSKGVMYFANGGGVLQFNGTQWTAIPLPKISAIKSIAIDKSDRIYIGGKRDFGYLKKDTKAQYKFVSLAERLDSLNRDFLYIWYVKIFNDTVYFQTNHFLFSYYEDQLSVYKSSTRLHSLNELRGKLLMREYDFGLKFWNGRSLTAIKNGDFFHGSSPYIIFPKKNGEALYLNRRDGFVESLADKFTIIRTKNSKEIQQALPYRGTLNQDHLFAISTLGNGVYLIDEEIQIKYHLNKKTGLISSDTKNIFRANDNSLWVATDRGISRIEDQSPFRIFDDRFGLDEKVNNIIRYKGQLYLCHSVGVSYFNGQTFKAVRGVKNISDEFTITPSGLFIAGQEGVHKIKGDQAFLVSEHASFGFLQVSQKIPIFLSCGPEGLIQIQNAKEYAYQDFQYELTAIVKESTYVYWLISDRTISRVHFDPQFKIKEKIQFKAKGRNFSWKELTKVDSNIYAHKDDGLYIYNKQEKKFEREKFFSQWIPKPKKKVISFQKDSLGNYWLHRDKELGILKKKKNASYSYQSQIFKRISDYLNLRTIYHEKDGLAWLVADDAVIKYNPKKSVLKEANYSTYINTILINRDSVLQINQTKEYEFEYSENSISFQLSIPAYDESHRNEFQYILEGQGKKWSKWMQESSILFSNLFEGNYQFRVRGKDIYGRIYEEAQLPFLINAPFYRSIFAYFFYLLMLVFLIYSLIRYRTQKIENEKRALAKLVDERSSELKMEKEKVERQSEQLIELDRVKTQFFSNISHEFRTPLTLILGPIEQLIAKARNNNQKQDFQVIRTNAKRLLQLINQLLDIAKLENKEFPLSLSKQSLSAFVQGIVKNFEIICQEKEINLRYEVEEEINFFFDRTIMERILLNLLSNAVKFTGKNGSILIHCKRKGNKVLISVQDSGVGIPADKIDHIFNRFYQVDASNKRQYEGSGIGLAYCKELAERHSAKIHVESQEKKGSTFTITLPYSSQNYKKSEFSEQDKSELFENHEFIGQQVETVKADILVKRAKRNERILIVDDNSELRNYLRRCLNEDYQIELAEDALLALKRIKKSPPDLILSDVMMPVLSGNEFCKQLKNDINYSHIPIILLTAKSSDLSKIEGLYTGADDYITKPFNLEELKLRIKNILDNRRLVKEKFSAILLPDVEKLSLESTNEQFILNLNKLIYEEMPKSTITVNKLADLLSMSRASLGNKVKAITGKAVSKYILSLKLTHAEKLLKQSNLTASEVAFQSGFQSLSYFTKVFKEAFKMTPKEYQNS